MANPRLQLAAVQIDACDAAAASLFNQEVRTLLEPLTNASHTLPADLELSVITTMDLDSRVDRIRREHGTYLQPYRSQRTGGRAAVAIAVIDPVQPPWRVTLVADARMWFSVDAASVVARVYALGFTLGCALHDLRETISSPPDDPLSSCRSEFYAIAEDLDRTLSGCSTALALCRSVQDSSSNVVKPSEFLGDAMIAAAAELAEDLCVFAAIDVQLYRVTGVGLEDLFPRAAMLLSAALRATLEAFAIFASDDRSAMALEVMRNAPGLRTYILPHFAELAAAISEADRGARLARFVEQFDQMVIQLGLRMEALPDRSWFLHVSEPKRCPIGDAVGSVALD